MPQIPDYIVWRDGEGELVLYDSWNGGYHALNGTAAIIWRAIARGETLTQIIERLAAEYDAPRAVLEGDIATFVEFALSKNLLVPGAPA